MSGEPVDGWWEPRVHVVAARGPGHVPQCAGSRQGAPHRLSRGLRRRQPVPARGRAAGGQWSVELETNLRDDLSFTITEKAPPG